MIASKQFGDLAVRLRQPAVSGDLFAGTALGNATLVGLHAFDGLHTDPTRDLLARFGVLLLLFEVADAERLASALLATNGAVATFVLASTAHAPDNPLLVRVFLSTTLCATSVDITARDFQDICDVESLIVLRAFLSHLFKVAAKLRTRCVLLATGLSFRFLLAWAADAIGLAPIIGAFVACLFVDRGERGIDELVTPITSLFAPVFVLMSAKTNLASFAHVDVLAFAALLTIAAIDGKLITGAVALSPKDVSSLRRTTIGFGLIARGAVELISRTRTPRSSSTARP